MKLMPRSNMNVVIFENIKYLSEIKPRHERLKQLLCNWKTACVAVVLVLTAKSAIEQLIMLVRNG